MQNIRKFGILAILSGLLAVPLAAHHGNAAYDEGTKVTVKGVATEWIFENPHTILKFDVKDDSCKEPPTDVIP
jgi:Family of unknown function (DUF6152)